ncbi:zinc finger family protein [Dorcoceras hygrometricum]|uniref:Zinc finger family protein n=1 Tax=Dorcoceras hygrometricum TaxID=472368 RepID=A0A2Z7BSI3_9LAMI|nr:zinc finger family protein [Dorcoceras hygrometricum]
MTVISMQSHVGDVESSNPRNAGEEQAPATTGGSLGGVTDLEAGANENKPCLGKYVSDCPRRICHLNKDAANQDSGPLFQLGCSCRDDLAVAHKHCVEAWFKIESKLIISKSSGAVIDCLTTGEHSQWCRVPHFGKGERQL